VDKIEEIPYQRISLRIAQSVLPIIAIMLEMTCADYSWPEMNSSGGGTFHFSFQLAFASFILSRGSTTPG